MPESWRLKVERAEKHLAELQTDVEHYEQQCPFEATRQRGRPRCREHRDCWRYNLRVTHQPAPGLAIVAGDVLHNARSALDHLAVAVAPRSRRSSAGFPIEVEDIWARRGRRYIVRDSERRRRFKSAIEGMPEQAVEVIRDVQPYRRGERSATHVLYLLSRLENADKHRQLIPFAAGLNHAVAIVQARGQTIELPMPDLPDGLTFVADGNQIAHFEHRLAPTMPPVQEAEVTIEIRGTMVVAINIPNDGQGRGNLPRFMPLLSLLETLLRQIRDEVIPALEPYARATV